MNGIAAVLLSNVLWVRPRLVDMVMKNIFSFPFVVVCLAAVISPVASQTVAKADDFANECSDVVVVAARGSSQQRSMVDEHYPQDWRFVQDGRQGWEGDTLHAMYKHIDDYARRAYGVDAFQRVSFLPLNEEYPAVPVMGSDAGYGSIPFDRIRKSSDEGAESAIRTINDYEAASGCSPRYLLTGYSQGALALQSIEAELQQRGRLAGAIYLGDPMKVHEDPRNHIVGKDIRNGVMVAESQLPAEVGQIASGNRTEYCIETDFVCNLAEENGENFVVDYGGDHRAYFRGPVSTMEERDQVAENFLNYVSQ